MMIAEAGSDVGEEELVEGGEADVVGKPGMLLMMVVMMMMMVVRERW